MKSKLLGILLTPFNILYGTGVGIRNIFFDIGLFKSKEFNLPIISVGNITVGGTGKTPHTEYIVSFLQNTHKVAVLSRGYKRTTSGFELASNESTTAQIGDELKQIKTKFPEIIVAADAERANGINEIQTQFPEVQVIVLDDAFQHRRVKPGLSILLIDYGRMIHKDRLLPAGRLRESPKQMKRADIIIVTKSPQELKPFEMRTIESDINITNKQRIFFSSFEYGEIVPIFPEFALHINIKMCNEEDYMCMAMSGLANPKPFEEFIKNSFSESSIKNFPDHHAFSLSDLKEAEDEFKETGNQKKIILVTEKDAVKIKEISKLPNSVKPYIFYIPIKPIILNHKGEEFESIVHKFIQNKTRA